MKRNKSSGGLCQMDSDAGLRRCRGGSRIVAYETNLAGAAFYWPEHRRQHRQMAQATLQTECQDPVWLQPPRRSGCAGAEIAMHGVVVVGAGPVGLSLAIDLAQRGQPVVLLDDADRIGEGSRAICFSKRSLEFWDRLGSASAWSTRAWCGRSGRSFTAPRCSINSICCRRRGTSGRLSSTSSSSMPRPIWSIA